MKIQILVDNPHSWYVPYANFLVLDLKNQGHDVTLIHSSAAVTKGDILCLLACQKIFRKLELNIHNLVVHESDLPKGKGWSPLTWQILEGKQRIPVTLFEAASDIDSGPIYSQKFITFTGYELLSEIKNKQGLATNELVKSFVNNYPYNIGKKQVGNSTFYERRTARDSEININQSIKSQFNLLRIVDNERYPAFFYLNGNKYLLKIEKEED